jgi:hypothetical protein
MLLPSFYCGKGDGSGQQGCVVFDIMGFSFSSKEIMFVEKRSSDGSHNVIISVCNATEYDPNFRSILKGSHH